VKTCGNANPKSRFLAIGEQAHTARKLRGAAKLSVALVFGNGGKSRSAGARRNNPQRLKPFELMGPCGTA
jgi:hypothetical protein